MKQQLWLCLAALGALQLNTACEDSLKRVSLIEETRVLGAHCEVANEPLRSSPRPGEQATVRFFLAAPSGAPKVSYALSVCAVTPSFLGVPKCVGAPFSSQTRGEVSPDPVQIAFQVPPELDLERTPHALVQGVICAEGSLTGGDAPRCIMANAETEVVFEFDLGSATASNSSPVFDSEALTLDAEPWLERAPEAACGDLLQVLPGSEHRLALEVADAEFESLEPDASGGIERETLLASLFSDAGELNHAFVSLQPGTSQAEREVSWVAPEAGLTETQIARFYFVLRDERGGQDFTTRALCVAPSIKQ